MLSIRSHLDTSFQSVRVCFGVMCFLHVVSSEKTDPTVSRG